MRLTERSIGLSPHESSSQNRTLAMSGSVRAQQMRPILQAVLHMVFGLRCRYAGILGGA